MPPESDGSPQPGRSVYDPTDLVGRQLFNVLAMVGESDLIRLRTQEDVKVAKTKGRLCGSSLRAITGKKRTRSPCPKVVSAVPLSSPTCSVSPRSTLSQVG